MLNVKSLLTKLITVIGTEPQRAGNIATQYSTYPSFTVTDALARSTETVGLSSDGSMAWRRRQLNNFVLTEIWGIANKSYAETTKRQTYLYTNSSTVYLNTLSNKFILACMGHNGANEYWPRTLRAAVFTSYTSQSASAIIGVNGYITTDDAYKTGLTYSGLSSGSDEIKFGTRAWRTASNTQNLESTYYAIIVTLPG